MKNRQSPLTAEIGQEFLIEGRLLGAEPFSIGHINETYIGLYQTSQGIRKYLHQKINTQVFKEPEKLMENILRVTRHIRQKLLMQGGNPDRQCLNLIPTRQGNYVYQAADGSIWRTYQFIVGAKTYEVPQNPQQVYAAAWAYGNFQAMLIDLPGDQLHDTIPDFHNTPLRFNNFLQVLQKDPLNRAITAPQEIEFILEHEADTALITERLALGIIPERITHNDTKLNNVLIDDQTGEGICVIDLDTTMPGSSLYDFGDMVRSSAVAAAEDEPDLSKVYLDLSLFEQITKGYLEATRGFISWSEVQLLPYAGKLITLEQAIRFLTDYLNGDLYYKTTYPFQNLARARTQIKLVSEMERQMETMISILDKYASGGMNE